MKKLVTCVVAFVALDGLSPKPIPPLARLRITVAPVAPRAAVASAISRPPTVPFPFGTQVRVTNLSNQRSAVVTINDRGPFVHGRIIDVSTGAAGVLGMRHSGVASVCIEVVARHARRRCGERCSLRRIGLEPVPRLPVRRGFRELNV